VMFGSYQTVGHVLLVSCKVLQLKHVEVMYWTASDRVC